MNIHFGASLDDPLDRLQFNSFKSHETNDDDNLQEQQTIIYEPMWLEPQQLEGVASVCRVCPGCARTVGNTQLQLICKSPRSYLYAAHLMCAQNSNQFIQFTRTARKYNPLNMMKKPKTEIGCREYLVSLVIEHPLTSHKFYSTSRRLMQINSILHYDATQNKQEDFEPNIIILPVKEMKCCLTIKPLYFSEQKYQSTLLFRVDVNEETEGICNMRAEDHNIVFDGEFEIIEARDTKMKIVDEMNFKYRKQYLEENFVRFRKFCVQFKSSGSDINPESNRSCQKQKSESISEKEQVSEKASSSQHFSPAKAYESAQEQQSSCQNEFIAYIKTKTGSVQFQKRAKTYKVTEIDKFIMQILPHMQEVILDRYANYMFQELLTVCNIDQRMRVIMSVGPQLAHLVCQEKGTFVFQKLVLSLVEPSQFLALCNFILNDFKKIALDSQGHHFLRRLFQKMPKELILHFLPTIHQNFIQLSTSRGAVFIIQLTLKGLQKLEQTKAEYSYYLKKFLEDLTLHTDQLIGHQFGNYLIQQAYDSIELDRLEGLSDYIVKFFADYSCQKYSSNVTTNCIKKYWTKKYTLYTSLKQKLDRKRIRQMYQNKEGNSVLLQIMELKMDLGLKDKISEIIRNEEPSKFNNQRWVSLTGKSKTGAVGTNYISFSEAHSFTKKKHYKK